MVRATITHLKHDCHHAKTLHGDHCDIHTGGGAWADVAGAAAASQHFVFEHSSTGVVHLSPNPGARRGRGRGRNVADHDHLHAFKQTLAKSLSVPSLAAGEEGEEGVPRREAFGRRVLSQSAHRVEWGGGASMADTDTDTDTDHARRWKRGGGDDC